VNATMLANLASVTVRLALRALRIVAPDVLPRVLALLVGRANVRGHDLGTASASRELRSLPPRLPGRPTNDVARLEAAFTSEVIESPARVERIARSEPADAARDAYLSAAKELGASRWRRVLSPGACPLCVSWAGEFDLSVGFRRHPHCSCTPELVEEVEASVK
jgi:hypothetical protein